MILITHVAVGAVTGGLVRRPTAALLLGIAAHAALDLVPHDDLPAPVEASLGGLALGLLAGRPGLPAGVRAGAIGCVLPDLEHLLPGRSRFPTHGPRHGLLTGLPTISTRQQAVAAALVLGLVLARPRRQRRSTSAIA